jgi:Flp pilus assembly protein TadG
MAGSRTRVRRHRLERLDRGAAAVEFALVLPIVLLLIFGAIQYGLYFWAMQGGSDVARDAARMGAVGDPAGCTTFQTNVKDELKSFTSSSSAGAAIVTRTYTDGPAHTVGVTDVEIGDNVDITVRFNSLDLNFPFLPFVNNGTVSSHAISRVEYLPTSGPYLDCS